MKNDLILATDLKERVIHWVLAVSCLLLCFTGLIMMFHSLNFLAVIFGGLLGVKYVHNYTGIVFAISLVLAIGMWWKEAGIFSMPEDWEWVKAAGGYLWKVNKVPEVGKYNPGQKLFFLTVAVFGVLMVITGLLIWFPIFSGAVTAWMILLHVLGFVVIFAFFFVHLYLGTIGSPGSLQAMTSGWVTRAWAKTHHPKWLAEEEAHGKLIIKRR